MDLNRYWEKAMTYEAYVLDLINKAENTPPDDPDYYKLNRSRTKRLRKFQPQPDFHQVKHDLKAIAISETWCGDSAQNLPVIDNICKIAGIPFRVIYRDEFPELIDAFLTNGSISIPKVIFFNSDTGEPKFSWGSRPKPAQDMVRSMGKNYNKALHSWYAKDKGQTLEQELLQLLRD